MDVGAADLKHAEGAILAGVDPLAGGTAGHGRNGPGLRIYPNPSHGRAITIEPIGAGAGTTPGTSLEVIDLRGRTLAILEAERGAGRTAFRWDARVRGRALPAGVYFLTVRGGGLPPARARVVLLED
jgi:hypothetical protein